jgi:DNA-binding NtrC family response regulator
MHILVVDDDRDVRDVLLQMLAMSGFATTAADSAIAMREILAGDEIRIDAVVLDCLMPGEPSAELALHAKGLRLPVVMISGDPGSMKFAHEHNLQLLHKPFGRDDLITAIEVAVASGKFGQRRNGPD